MNSGFWDLPWHVYELGRLEVLDLDAERLDTDRLQRVAKAMSIQQHLDEWLRSKRRYDEDPDVIENASNHLKA